MAIEIAIVSGIVSIIVLVIGKLVSSRLEKSQAESSKGDAAKALSDAAKTQVDTYNSSIVKPLVDRVLELEEEVVSLKETLSQIQFKRDTEQGEFNQRIEKIHEESRNLTMTVNSQREQIVLLIEQSEIKDKVILHMQIKLEHLQVENEKLQRDVNYLQAENALLKLRLTGGSE